MAQIEFAAMTAGTGDPTGYFIYGWFLFVFLIILLSIGQVAGRIVKKVRRGWRTASAEQVLRGSRVSPQGSGKGEGTQHNKAVTFPLRIGEVELRAADEPKHLLFAGSTGTGKTQGINQVLKVIRARKARAIVADAGGEALAAFYQPGDLILNPFDKRSVDWSPFAELRADYDRSRLARAAIPDAEGDSREWHVYAQTLLGEVIWRMHTLNDHSTSELIRYVMTADRQELSALLQGTAAEMLTTAESDRMLANTRAIASAFLVAWRSLPNNGTFSVRDWIRGDADARWWTWRSSRP
jgi:hypothetical protein